VLNDILGKSGHSRFFRTGVVNGGRHEDIPAGTKSRGVLLSDGTTRKIAMADDKTKRAPQDSEFLSLEDDEDIEYWTMKFGVSRERLARAVARAGRSAEAVEKYLKATWPYPGVDDG
jgi:hypothetical protein